MLDAGNRMKKDEMNYNLCFEHRILMRTKLKCIGIIKKRHVFVDDDDDDDGECTYNPWGGPTITISISPRLQSQMIE